MNTKKKIRKIFEKNIGVIIDDHSDNEENLRRISDNFEKIVFDKDQKSETVRKWKYCFPIVAVIVVCVLIGSFILADIPVVRALKSNIENYLQSVFNDNSSYSEDGQLVKNFDSLEKLYQNLGYTPLEFTWIPAGFELVSIQTTNDTNNNLGIFYEYIKSNTNQFISISIMPLSEVDGISGFSYTDGYEKIKLGDMQVFLSKESPYNAILGYHGVYEIGINTDVEKQELLRLIEGIK
ncbi:DUF4367 domain-containing protein [Christensenella intestinihominis]|uniref:DUF4367 domain-containing protein n=1 Tax=Christensenella intestinihominis TaxID=1851429 RepID=UPI00082964FA|nr:DUF4367 domain-containing protein [Christensenella intestinihominis]